MRNRGPYDRTTSGRTGCSLCLVVMHSYAVSARLMAWPRRLCSPMLMPWAIDRQLVTERCAVIDGGT